jgi:amyloid beta precursor protein binding protein 1
VAPLGFFLAFLQPRAKVVCELLQEMNDGVRGDWVEDDAASIIKSNPAFFTGFSVVVATQLVEEVLVELAALLWKVCQML